MQTKEAARRSPPPAAEGKETDSSPSESNELIHHDMEANSSDLLPCSPFAVDYALRMSHLGVIWGSCYGPFKAKRLGLSGSSQALHIVKTVGKCGIYTGLFTAIFSLSNCGIERYRQQRDWVNTMSAGVIVGAAFGAGTRKWKKVAVITGLYCALSMIYDD
ncbi:hypothetical protein C2S52_017392 [Perilla frutescens var. hirtella]|nr:hypothetical protein C2S52_017392 [Perilla frutescens var. hirtella]KAH6811176.1 hypothetical protein C2S51_024938 [Perilla frutescens var. frutescens]